MLTQRLKKVSLVHTWVRCRCRGFAPQPLETDMAALMGALMAEWAVRRRVLWAPAYSAHALIALLAARAA